MSMHAHRQEHACSCMSCHAFITAYKLLAVQHKQTAVDKDSGILDGKKKSARPGVRHECHVNHVTMH